MRQHHLYKNEIEISRNLTGLARNNLVLEQIRHQTIGLLMGLGGLSLAFVAMGAYIYRSSQSTIQPYVVTVDSHGVVLEANALKQPEIPQELVIEQICNFIKNLRMVTTDKQLQQDAIMKVYAFVRPHSPVIKTLNQFYSEQNPFAKHDFSNISVQIVNALTTNDNTLQIDWDENYYEDQELSQTKKMRALIIWSLLTPNTNNADSFLLNPLGICIESLHISQFISNQSLRESSVLPHSSS